MFVVAVAVVVRMEVLMALVAANCCLSLMDVLYFGHPRRGARCWKPWYGNPAHGEGSTVVVVAVAAVQRLKFGR